MGLFATPKASSLLLLLCLLAGIALCWFNQPPPTVEATVQNAPYVVGGPEVREVRVVDVRGDNVVLSGPVPLDPKLEEGRVVEQRVRLATDTKLRIFLSGEAFVDRQVKTYSPFLLYGFIAVFAVVVLLLPYAMSRGSGQQLGAWYQLLSEPNGGYSLARIQLLLWSLPVAVLYCAVSAVNRSFLSIDTQLQLLLGLSGITTFLSTAASPPSSEGSTISNAALSDMVTGWDGHGDVSRYQYLVLSLLGSLVLVVSFLQKLDFPHIPTELLYLVGGSQVTYIATKAVKQAKSAPQASAATAPDSTPVTSAPSVLIALTAAPEGHVVQAPAEVATLDGSVRLPD